jgi:hypothetical protein
VSSSQVFGAGNLDVAPQAPLTVSLVAEPPGLASDFDGDNDVDGHDFLIWQRHLGGAGNSQTGDATGDGAVDGADLGIWRAEYNRTPPQQSAAASLAVQADSTDRRASLSFAAGWPAPQKTRPIEAVLRRAPYGGATHLARDYYFDALSRRHIPPLPPQDRGAQAPHHIGSPPAVRAPRDAMWDAVGDDWDQGLRRASVAFDGTGRK